MRPGNPAPPTGEITPDTAGEWLSMVARATGYGVTLLDAQYHIVWASDASTDLNG